VSGRKTFVGGDILLASELNGFLMDQAVMVFDDSAARTTALPSPSEGMVTYVKDVKQLQRWTGTAWANVVSGFTASSTITSTNSSWPVPTLASPIVKVTVIGGGGAGGNGDGSFGSAGGNGGTSTFNAGGAGSISASGGTGGKAGTASNGPAGTPGKASANGGQGTIGGDRQNGETGNGGAITVGYLNLAGVSTVNVTIGAGGAGVSGTGGAGGAGGRGEVIVEYVAG
jgi:hypothetical protein